MEYEQASPATTFSKKLANGGGLSGKHVYDGVFGGTVKPGSRVEDYREIFGGSATCSIPILDFPELNERNIPMESRSLKPDYSSIFGGCGEEDFAVPYEELFSKAKRVKSRTQEARVQAEARPKHSNSSEEKRAPLPEVSSLPFDNVKQFNLLYNRSNPGSKNGTIGTTHIAQLHEVPGYTRLIDEQATQQLSNNCKAVPKNLNNACPNANASEGIKARKPGPKAVSGPQPREPIKETSINNSEVEKKSRRNNSFANDISFDTFEMGLGSSTRSINSKSGAFRSNDSGSFSPPLLDEEVDANLAAAAVRKAIEEAQAKIKIAKELMERKKQGASFTNGLKAKKRETKATEKMNRLKEEEAREVPVKDTRKEVSNGLTQHDIAKPSRATWDFKESSMVKAAIRESNRMEMKTEEKINRCGDEAHEIHREGTIKQVSSGLTEHETIKPSRATWDFKESSMVKAAIRESSRALAECGNGTEGFSVPSGAGEGRERESGSECKEKMEINPVEVAFQWDIYRHNINPAEEFCQLEEIEDIIRVVDENDEAPHGEYESREPEEDAEFVIHELEENTYRRQREAENGDEMEIQSNEVPREENENGLDEIHRFEGNVRGEKEDLNMTGYGRKQEEYCYQEDNEESQLGDPETEGTGEGLEVHIEDVTVASQGSFQEEENSEKRTRENCGTESDGSLVDSTESESMFREDYHLNEIGKHKTCEDVESDERIQEEIHLGTEGKSNLEVNEVEFEVTEEVTVSENEGVIEHSYPEETGRGSKVAEEADDEVAQENVQTGDTEQDLVRIDRTKNQTSEVYLTEEAVYGLGATDQDAKEPDVLINHDEDNTFFETSSEEECENNSIDVQTSQEPHSFEEEEKIMKVSHVEDEEKMVQVSQEGRTNQNIDEEENYQETQTMENNLQKKNEHRERKEELRMREMEKEKERMAVERAIREVRERAFAEARERAEREKKSQATRQKSTAEVKGRLEKVSTETNSKAVAEKASMEAKLKAQRAAVERATAEARERALEKALSDKTSFKMRNQAEKSSGASRDYGIKPNDQHNKGSGPAKSSGTDRELPERCKATFERNQRTAERAAKALAEKNMRDLLVQKEQAERNRLAESLDAEVKRWSSGKERNLRALLSTLQYILGSDSGWQPVPLTDLISTAAVKKAYRKATLLVHPDKLQQRGASIQQKYTCEKVFDLLKDAWNNFSSEER